MKILSLGLEGLMQASRRGLFDWLSNQDADIVCLQNISTKDNRLGSSEMSDYLPIINNGDGKHGNSIYLRVSENIERISLGLGSIDEHDYWDNYDSLGMVTYVKYSHMILINICSPRGETVDQVKSRVDFLNKIRMFLYNIKKEFKIPIIMVGDLGFDMNCPTEEEELWLDSILELGFIDVASGVNWQAKGNKERRGCNFITSSLASVVYDYSIVDKRFSSYYPTITSYHF